MWRRQCIRLLTDEFRFADDGRSRGVTRLRCHRHPGRLCPTRCFGRLGSRGGGKDLRPPGCGWARGGFQWMVHSGSGPWPCSVTLLRLSPWSWSWERSGSGCCPRPGGGRREVMQGLDDPDRRPGSSSPGVHRNRRGDSTPPRPPDYASRPIAGAPHRNPPLTIRTESWTLLPSCGG